MITIKFLKKRISKSTKSWLYHVMDQLEKIDQAKQAIEGKFELSMASSHPNNVEFTSIEANKGTALLRYQQLQISNLMKFLRLETAEMISNSLKWQLPLLQWEMLLSRFSKKRISSQRQMMKMALPMLSNIY